MNEAMDDPYKDQQREELIQRASLVLWALASSEARGLAMAVLQTEVEPCEIDADLYLSVLENECDLSILPFDLVGECLRGMVVTMGEGIADGERYFPDRVVAQVTAGQLYREASETQKEDALASARQDVADRDEGN